MLFQIFKFAAAVVITHYLACLIQTVLHAQLGHHRAGGSMFRTHLRNHHAIYSRVFTAAHYIDEDQSLTAYYLLPITICAALAFWLLPLALALTVIATFLVSLAMHVYLHVEYHLENSVWNNYGWFRRRQRLHRIHHELPNRNFGVIEFVWDRVLGTYSEEELATTGEKL